jgi:hypothetical protein
MMFTPIVVENVTKSRRELSCKLSTSRTFVVISKVEKCRHTVALEILKKSIEDGKVVHGEVTL